MFKIPTEPKYTDLIYSKPANIHRQYYTSVMLRQCYAIFHWEFIPTLISEAEQKQGFCNSRTGETHIPSHHPYCTRHRVNILKDSKVVPSPLYS